MVRVFVELRLRTVTSTHNTLLTFMNYYRGFLTEPTSKHAELRRFSIRRRRSRNLAARFRNLVLRFVQQLESIPKFSSSPPNTADVELIPKMLIHLGFPSCFSPGDQEFQLVEPIGRGSDPDKVLPHSDMACRTWVQMLVRLQMVLLGPWGVCAARCL